MMNPEPADTRTRILEAAVRALSGDADVRIAGPRS